MEDDGGCCWIAMFMCMGLLIAMMKEEEVSVRVCLPSELQDDTCILTVLPLTNCKSDRLREDGRALVKSHNERAGKESQVKWIGDEQWMVLETDKKTHKKRYTMVGNVCSYVRHHKDMKDITLFADVIKEKV